MQSHCILLVVISGDCACACQGLCGYCSKQSLRVKVLSARADGLPLGVEQVSIVWQRGAKLQFSSAALAREGRAEWAGQVLKQARL